MMIVSHVLKKIGNWIRFNLIQPPFRRMEEAFSLAFLLLFVLFWFLLKYRSPFMAFGSHCSGSSAVAPVQRFSDCAGWTGFGPSTRCPGCEPRTLRMERVALPTELHGAVNSCYCICPISTVVSRPG